MAWEFTCDAFVPIAAQNIVAKEGIQGLFLRGLGTKLITNGIQVRRWSLIWSTLFI